MRSSNSVADKITLRLAPAVETLDALLAEGQAGTFDFAFIDADKENYDNYYVADPSVQDAETVALRALNEKLHYDERVFISLIAVGDGMSLAVKQGD